MHEPINIVPDLPACPFLDKEKNECLIESVKPIACRLYGTVNKCINGKGIDIDAEVCNEKRKTYKKIG